MTSLQLNRSLTASLFQQLLSSPEKTAVIFRDNKGREITLSRELLYQKTIGYASGLKKHGVQPGDILIIALRHTPELLFTLLSTWFAGAVPSLFPYKDLLFSGDAYHSQLAARLEKSQARGVIALDESSAPLKERINGNQSRIITVSQLAENTRENIFYPHLDSNEDSLAYIQYTSGTTGHNKGVLLTHNAVTGTLKAIGKTLQQKERDVVVNWLPLYHDFGLFAGFLFPLYAGLLSVLISPFAWLRYPETWLGAISRYKGTITYAPNSGLDHTVKFYRPEKYGNIRLDSLRRLVVGSEPIIPESMDSFFQLFHPLGLCPNAICSGYGMAENTLVVTTDMGDGLPCIDSVQINGKPRAERAVPSAPKSPETVHYVSCGIPVEGVKLAILDSSGERLPERCIGEIAFRSPYMFSGYLDSNLNKTSQKKKTNGYFRSGDLGYTAGGKLFICGRKRDLIITAGRNYFPEDLEASLDSISGIIPRNSVALGIPDPDTGTEKLVVIAGIQTGMAEDHSKEIKQSIRRKLFHNFGVTAEEVYLVKPGWIIKTHNGKISRTAARTKYLSWKKENRF